ncbi:MULTISPECIES: alpha/beta fold hydrolase [unclassified Streptococcus]|uniref:alpha/beta fold hydrolase n=1 Tax=unclassified Streptococcus TaxID=2608887 RepID=UPI0020C8CE7B|nr:MULTISPECIES: alpha/beta hydrolase [unclassified Streptococcus]MDU1976746.1 alpha/beta hydrolase [Streptococcus parasanguinis]MCP8963339.1 alpha/beta hydrolase [Streptococcus sp. CF8_St5-12]MCP8981239.1 alpha/beta hydrolase [Streptococcus sp. CF8_St5-16]MCP8983272.1 alpha/beta hydrolase [Streptococcus sp. CF8_St5-13]MCP9040262.1 alpha/beta hydrolase [Streptococcus sp. CF8_St5-11]
MPMKKFKKFSWIIFVVLILFLGGTFGFHQLSLQKESKLLMPIGKKVVVNGHQMNVYIKGEGSETIVFLSGAGIASPILDFKNLTDSLSKKYKVVVVERAGYGFSEDSDQSRDVMTVFSETRQALSQAEVSGPYVIVSHSMASLESLAWQEKYPNEVRALIGLDWALPASYKDLKEHPTLMTLAYWTSKIGLLRYFPESFYIKNPTLTETERQQYKLLAYKQLMSQAMLHESRLAKENAKKVPSSINPKIPALLLVSNGEGTTFSQSEWQRYAERFASDQSNVQVVYMDAPHDLYHYQSNAIVSRIKEFLENN